MGNPTDTLQLANRIQVTISQAIECFLVDGLNR